MLSSPVLFLVNLLHLAITIYIWIIIIRALISWVSPDPFNPVVRFLYQATEPVLRPIRRSLPTYQIGLDLSPMIVIIALEIIDRFVVPTLVSALLY
jgi:YggT family protein